MSNLKIIILPLFSKPCSKDLSSGILGYDVVLSLAELLQTFRRILLSFLSSVYMCTTRQTTRSHNAENQNLNFYWCESLGYLVSRLPLELEANACLLLEVLYSSP